MTYLVWYLLLPLVASSSVLQFQDESPDTFKNPRVESLPKFRYWLPDASVAVEAVQRDISDLASAGAGGLEFVPFYFYGNPSDAPPPTDWNKFGFGTPAFSNLFDGALQAAADNSILMDFSMGASEGQGTPATAGSPRRAMHLVCNIQLAFLDQPLMIIIVRMYYSF
ncbi:hypothetical protein N7537_010582 [Penicillium hordei]|uniref:Uncharacterized protein n=1 Tax=Penicillium hordei TaxID=40994 RepID=A0AAD6DV94_9EURO|nr:uncharacterized protein N7537_010582 [Penicillium hordei]KAJ5593678.1 hypothetical protein N7537_010582 [Penicillium hordei]